MELGFCIFFGILFSWISNSIFNYPANVKRILLIGSVSGVCSSVIGVIAGFVDIHEFNLTAVLLTGIISLLVTFLRAHFPLKN